MPGQGDTPSTRVKVSVVVPCYNGRRYLDECLQSVIAGGYPGTEVIVVDDGSTEPIRDVVEAFAPLARYVRQPNAGPSVARNTGFAASSAEYIRFLDADDYLLPGPASAAQINVLDNDPATGLVYAQAVQVDARGRPLGVRKPPFASTSYVRSGLDELANLILRNHILPSTALIRRGVLERVGVFRTELRTGEDWELWLRVARAANVAYLAQPVAAYRIHESSSTVNLEFETWLHSHLWVLDSLQADRYIGQRFAAQIRLARASLYARAVRMAVRDRDRARMWEYARVALPQNAALHQWSTAAWCVWLLTKGSIPDQVYTGLHTLKRRAQLSRMSGGAGSLHVGGEAPPGRGPR
jgi:glycosyltransferase involved in cell wall biosynthesis